MRQGGLKLQSSALRSSAHVTTLKQDFPILEYRRRYIESSRSGPKASASNSGESVKNGTTSSGPSWGLPMGTNSASNNSIKNDKKASNLRNGEAPAWGIGTAPSWASPILEEKITITKPSQPIIRRQLDYEKLNTMNEDEPQKRPLNLPPYPGPESSRAGRPEPDLNHRSRNFKSENHHQISNSYERQIEPGRVGPQRHENRLSIRRFSPQIGSHNSTIPDTKVEFTWKKLNRRNVASPNEELPKNNGLIEERMKREEEAKLKRYTPLSTNATIKVAEVHPSKDKGIFSPQLIKNSDISVNSNTLQHYKAPDSDDFSSHTKSIYPTRNQKQDITTQEERIEKEIKISGKISLDLNFKANFNESMAPGPRNLRENVQILSKLNNSEMDITENLSSSRKSPSSKSAPSRENTLFGWALKQPQKQILDDRPNYARPTREPAVYEENQITLKEQSFNSKSSFESSASNMPTRLNYQNTSHEEYHQDGSTSRKPPSPQSAFSRESTSHIWDVVQPQKKIVDDRPIYTRPTREPALYEDNQITLKEQSLNSKSSFESSASNMPTRLKYQNTSHEEHHQEGSTYRKPPSPQSAFSRESTSHIWDSVQPLNRITDDLVDHARAKQEFAAHEENQTNVKKQSLSSKLSSEYGVSKTPSRSRYQDASHEEDLQEGSSSRRKKEKKKRGQEAKKLFSDEKIKLTGKEKDKAKRESQFLREERERQEMKQRLELKMERQRLKAEKKAAEKAARKAIPTPILLPDYITISNLATALKLRYEELSMKMKEMGYEETYPDLILNSENSSLIAMEYNFEPNLDKTNGEFDLKAREPHPNPSELPPRPPVITIMGHVDHGKTTLLDYLRKSSIAASEHGGITQHIGAFSVRMPSGKMMTFLDTPGHAAFLNMRQRGAHVTDIVVLVVAADDGVKPQTIEAINHAKASNVPMIVAINKIDKPDVDIEKVKQELARYGVEIEDIGGDTQVVCVSGKTGQGMEQLEETSMVLAEILDMRAEIDCSVEGWVLEASVKALGKVATILVRRGTLRAGNILVAGTTWAKVRILRNEAGIEVDEAKPGTPVEVDGWRDQPSAGDEALQATDEILAKRVVDYRIDQKERSKLAADMEAINSIREETRQKRALAKAAKDAALREKDDEMSADELAPPEPEAKSEGPKKIYFVVKGDVSGSIEAVQDQMNLLKTKEVEPVILRSAVGQLSKFDIEHAAAAEGHVVSFNLKTEAHIIRYAAELNVQIFENSIIYSLIDSVRDELSKHLSPIVSYSVLGEAEIVEIFPIHIKRKKTIPIAGCKIRNGTIKRNGKVRVLREGQEVFNGALSSLKIVKDDVLEVFKDNECGLAFEGWPDFQVGDQIQHYEEKYQKRYL